MWKLVLGFVLFAALSLFVIMQAGDKVDMSGESMERTPCMRPSRPRQRPLAPPSSATACQQKNPRRRVFFTGCAGRLQRRNLPSAPMMDRSAKSRPV